MVLYGGRFPAKYKLESLTCLGSRRCGNEWNNHSCSEGNLLEAALRVYYGVGGCSSPMHRMYVDDHHPFAELGLSAPHKSARSRSSFI